MKVVKKADISNLPFVKVLKNQIYEEIVHDAQYTGQKFIDPEFSPHNKVIVFNKTFEINIPWNRPSVIFLLSNYILIVQGLFTYIS